MYARWFYASFKPLREGSAKHKRNVKQRLRFHNRRHSQPPNRRQLLDCRRSTYPLAQSPSSVSPIRGTMNLSQPTHPVSET